MHIETLVLSTCHLEAQRHFYSQQLGLIPEHETAGSVTFRTGTTRLTWQQDDRARGFYHLAWDIPPAHVGAAESWLRARLELLAGPGGQTRFPPGEQWNTTNLYFEDPGGNILEFVARHDLRNEVALPFGTHSLMRLSEFGVVPDVSAAVRRLGTGFGMSPFNGGSDTFTPLGSHEGMLIVVREGRGWFPTGRPAVPAQFQLTWRSDGTRQVLDHHSLTRLTISRQADHLAVP